MSQSRLLIVVLAAGKGTRMKSTLPKVLHRVAGRAMIHHVLGLCEDLRAERSVVVVGPGMDQLVAEVAPYPTATQQEQLGTADAVKAAKPALEGALSAAHDLLVIYGDGPLITKETLAAMVEARRQPDAPDFIWLGFRPEDPTGYGRMILKASSHVDRIVEERDATSQERAINLCWAGLLLGRADLMFEMIERIDNNNAKQEYYLTSLVALAQQSGHASGVVETDDALEVRGVNSRVELAEAEAIYQDRLRRKAMEEGASLIDPSSVFFSWDTKLGRDIVVHPHVHFGPGVEVADGVEIRGFSHLEGAKVGPGAVIGPFARLRPGTVIARDGHVGNFVELKNALLGEGAKANHLSYLGDAKIGPGANIGAGTITCNYDGFNKSLTEIGAGAFIGSNSALVAPVKIGEGAIIGAGSTISQEIGKDDLALTRAPLTKREGAAKRFRERKHAIKQAAKKKKP